MNPLTPLELLDIIEREHGFESPSIRLALTRAKKVEELLVLYRECNEEGHFWLEIQGRISKLEEEMK